jgi:hypothetical protein
MTPVEIVSVLLLADADVVAAVAPGMVKAGRLPDNAVLPALAVREISRIERLKLRRTGKVRETSRVQVTVRANSYREQKAIVDLVIRACAGRTSAASVPEPFAITNAATGPDLIGDAGIFEQPQDFRVTHETDA